MAQKLARAEAERAELAENRAREQEATRLRELESTNKLRRRAVVVAVAAVAALILLTIAVAMWGAAQEQARIATEHGNNAEKATRAASRQLGNLDWVLGVRARDDKKDVLRSGHFFLKGAKDFQTAGEAALAKNATLAGTLGNRALVCTFLHGGDVDGAVFNRDESRILTWSRDGTARLWAVDRSEPLQIFKHEGWVNGAVFNRDESGILTWSEDGTARLWAVGQNEPLQIFKHERWVRGAVFNRDESRILTWSGDGTARLWAVGQSKPVQIFKHGDQVNGAVFNRDESRILTWSKDGTVRLWAVGQSEPVQIFKHGDQVNGAVFNRDESRILTWSSGTVWLWAVGQSKPVLTWERRWDGAAVGGGSKRAVQTLKHESSVNGAVFNRDESRILTWRAKMGRRGSGQWVKASRSRPSSTTRGHWQAALGH